MEKKLLLRIDWSGELKFGAQLSPRFTLMGIQLTSQPKVRATLDNRLEKEDWEVNPEVQQKGPSAWEFFEHLTIKPQKEAKGDAVYTLKLEAVFEEKEQDKTQIFRFQIVVSLKVLADQRREVVINASKGALLNTHGLDWTKFDKVVIGAHGEGALVNLSEGIIPDEIKHTDGTDDTTKNLFEVSPDFLYYLGVPRRTLLLRATLPNGKVRLYHLYADFKFSLGRNDLDCNVIYRFYRKSTEVNSPPVYLSRFLSRNHARITLWPEEIVLENLSTLGLEIQSSSSSGEFCSLERNASTSLSWEDVKQGRKIRLSQFASLVLKAFPARNNKLENQLKDILDPDNENLWHLGKNQGVDVLRLSREETFNWSEKNKKTLLSLSKKLEEDFEEKEKKWKEDNAWKKDLLAKEEEYFFLLRCVTLGNSWQDAMRLNERGSGIGTSHVTFYFCHDHFGMINSTPMSYEKADGNSERLGKDKPLSLEPGMKFQIGSVKFDVWEDYSAFLKAQ